MGDLVRRRTALDPADLDWLHRLVGEWQLLADLSFADLLLWVPLTGGPGRRFIAVAQLRPTTAPTAYQEDRVGQVVADRPQLWAAFEEGRIHREGDPEWGGGSPVREEAIPVRHADRVIAVIGRDTNLAAARTPSRLDIAYLQSASDLASMIADGTFPYPADGAADQAGPRVGDGLMRLDGDGVVVFASPNAVSAYRRLGFAGDLLGRDLGALTETLAPAADPIDRPVTAVATAREPRTGDIETAGATVQLRALPLRIGGRHIGAIVLVHDVTELRRRDRQLISKDATIREIHHRVKNNLQTVAALLRLQARRLSVPEARLALEESVRRVSSIAVVHETLSLTFDEAVGFDAIADRVLALVRDVAAGDEAVRVVREGSFGVLPAALATPLAMVMTELVQNAVEHGFPTGQGGLVRVRPARTGRRLVVEVVDDGAGLPPGFALGASPQLGLQIVRTLIEGELGGVLSVGPGREGGTRAAIDVPILNDTLPATR
ncbi:MAG TPA: histidine kinase N-terminal domain-containing protein [Mycobacteriales bacterium]|nr:histidine kinase N-terminal domain-containing protein [Mycobacteriales bacterium]